MRRAYLVPGIALALGLVVLAVQAAPPSDAGATELAITPQAGAWLICAASYTGPDAPELARQMAAKIRSQYQVPAYVFNRSDGERKKQQEELKAAPANPLIPVRRKTVRIEEQCAVLVGGYADMDAARKALDGIKAMKPPDLTLASGRPTVDMMISNPDGKGVVSKPVSPFVNAFVTRNPCLIAQQGSQPVAKVDPIWFKLNKDEEFSLMNNPQPWTLVVKQYVGARVVQSGDASKGGFLEKLWPGANSPGQALNDAALQARELAKVLRQLNFQAYVLHTRTSSVVTVGGFASPNDPDVQRTRQQLETLQKQMSERARGLLALNPQPEPMPVPRQ